MLCDHPSAASRSGSAPLEMATWASTYGLSIVLCHLQTASPALFSERESFGQAILFFSLISFVYWPRKISRFCFDALRVTRQFMQVGARQRSILASTYADEIHMHNRKSCPDPSSPRFPHRSIRRASYRAAINYLRDDGAQHDEHATCELRDASGNLTTCLRCHMVPCPMLGQASIAYR